MRKNIFIVNVKLIPNIKNYGLIIVVSFRYIPKKIHFTLVKRIKKKLTTY